MQVIVCDVGKLVYPYKWFDETELWQDLVTI